MRLDIRRTLFGSVLLFSATASAQHAGSANPAGGSSTAPRSGDATAQAISACASRCDAQARSCGQAAGNARSSRDANTWLQRARQCAAQCGALANQPQGAQATAMPTGDSQESGTTVDPLQPAEASGGDPDAQTQQILGQWQQRDQARLNTAEQNARQEVQRLLQMLCAQLDPSGQSCVTGAGGPGFAPLPKNAPLGDRRASDRWKKPVIAPGSTPAQAPGSSPQRTPGLALYPKGPPPGPPSDVSKGCYKTGVFPVVGNDATDLYMNTPLIARFEPASGAALVIKNTGYKEAWVGSCSTIPLNMVVPPRAGYDGNPPVTESCGHYRTKDDTRATRLVPGLGVKYWESDPAKCKEGAVQPGFTTLEEFGPIIVPPQEIQ